MRINESFDIDKIYPLFVKGAPETVADYRKSRVDTTGNKWRKRTNGERIRKYCNRKKPQLVSHSATKPKRTYVATLEDDFVKVGSSSNLRHRNSQLRRDCDYKAKGITTYFSADFEKPLHDGLAGSYGKQVAATAYKGREAYKLKYAVNDVLLSLTGGYEQYPYMTMPHIKYSGGCTYGGDYMKVSEVLVKPDYQDEPITVWVVDGTFLPLIPEQVIQSYGVAPQLTELSVTALDAKPAVYDYGIGVGSSPTQKECRAYPLWVAVDLLGGPKYTRFLHDVGNNNAIEPNEACSRVVWAAARAAVMIEKQTLGTQKYTEAGFIPPSFKRGTFVLGGKTNYYGL